MEEKNKEELILKWLDNSLNPKERALFEALDDYDELIKLDHGLKQFKAPEYNVSEEFKAITSSISTNKKPKENWTRQLLKVAAILLIGFSIFYYTSTLDTTVKTLMAEKAMIELPDGSQSHLNALSTLTYNKSKWNDKRNITLEGEAFFEVKKGVTFNVNTTSGTVTVLGTKFNIKHRTNFFEVVCYEGSVKITNDLKTSILKPGDSYLILDGKYIASEKENLKSPDWITNKSYFKSIPFEYVLNEFERQYNIKFDAHNIEISKLYSGSFSHTDIDLALKSITLPFNLNYSISNNTINLTSE